MEPTLKPKPLTPLETELVELVREFEQRLTALETSSQADAETAQTQRTNIDERLKTLSRRLAVVEQSLPCLTLLSNSLAACEEQCADLQSLCTELAQQYKGATLAYQQMEKAWKEQQSSLLVLKYQVQQLIAALRVLPA
jgi:chromosome segregation ATPase